MQLLIVGDEWDGRIRNYLWLVKVEEAGVYLLSFVFLHKETGIEFPLAPRIIVRTRMGSRTWDTRHETRPCAAFSHTIPDAHTKVASPNGEVGSNRYFPFSLSYKSNWFLLL